MLVKVNGNDSLNNRNNDEAEYNQEPNNLNNMLLNDDRNFYVWNVGSIVANSMIDDPVMRVSSSGYRSMVYGEFTNTQGRLRVMNNNTLAGGTVTGVTGNVIESTQNRYLHLSIAIDDTSNDWYVGASNMTANQNNWFNLHARGVTGVGNQSQGNNKSRILSLRDNSTDDANRVRIPRIFAQNISNTGSSKVSRVLVGYWDGLVSPNSLRISYGTVSGTGATATFATQFTNNSATASSSMEIANNNQTYRGSIYSAVACLSDGRPVVAWYDRDKMRLVFSFGETQSGTTINTTDLATWQSRAFVIQEAAGTHVDIAVDPDNNVHLAYYDVFNGGLYYAYIPSTWYNASAAQRADLLEIAKVDTYLSAGTKLTINVRNESTTTPAVTKYVPYISYFHASFAETRNSIRVAWPVTTVNETTGKMAVENGTDGDDCFTGKWEVMTVPALNIPISDSFICHGVPRTTENWVTPSGMTTYSNINRTILVGYMTDIRYEGAVLKRDLWAGQ